MADIRLTKRLDDGQAVMDCQNCELNSLQMCTALGCRNRLRDRLAEYEDGAPVRNGRWIKKPDQRCSGRYCSECDCHEAYERNYCPNCGAKMDLKEPT